MIDLHTHLLPAVDDGVETFEESLEILKELESHGITKAFVTPHYIEGTIYNSPRSDNLKLLAELERAAKEEGLGIELHIGSEIQIASNISDLLKSKTISPLGKSNYLLIELPISGRFDGYESILQNLISDGYKIILAHPERYISIQKDFSILERLKSLGILFQSNLSSILGEYGFRAKRTVKKMAKADLIFTFGTDVHHLLDFNTIDESLLKFKKIYGEAKLDVLLNENPARVLK